MKKIIFVAHRSPKDSPNGLDFLFRRPTDIDHTTEQKNKNGDPNRPCQDVPRPGKKLLGGSRRDHFLRRDLELLCFPKNILQSSLSLLYIWHSHFLYFYHASTPFVDLCFELWSRRMVFSPMAQFRMETLRKVWLQTRLVLDHPRGNGRFSEKFQPVFISFLISISFFKVRIEFR